MSGDELEPYQSGVVGPWTERAPIPVVARAADRAAAAAVVRAQRRAEWLATPLPTAEPDEVLILIFHHEFPNPKNRDVMKRYTYVATYRHEVGKWYLSHDATHRPHRAYTSEELLLFARPTGAPACVSHNAFYSPSIGPIRSQVWFLPTQAAR